MTRPRWPFPWRSAVLAALAVSALVGGQIGFAPPPAGSPPPPVAEARLLPPVDAADGATADESTGVAAQATDASDSVATQAGAAPARGDQADLAGGPTPQAGGNVGGSSLEPAAPGPTIEFQEAVAHESDAGRFAPGGRVEVGFVPAPGDPDVDGGEPVALPAGIASGTQIARESSGSLFADARSAALAGRASVAAGAARRSAAGSDVAADMVPAAFASRRAQVIGFLPYWNLNDAQIHLETLTTIAYFGLGVTPQGHLAKMIRGRRPTAAWAGWTSRRLTAIIQAAHRRHVRVVLTVQLFAWTRGQAQVQVAVLSNPAIRQRLAAEIAAAVRERGIDGVNLDFEPIARGQAQNYVRFVRSLRAALNRYHRGYELTVDTTGVIGNYDVARLTAPGAADAVVIMGYDYRIATSAPGAVSPLVSSGHNLRDTIRAYTARTSPGKIILALPWYGRAWSTASSKLTAQRVSDAKFGPSVTATYATAAALAARYGTNYLKTEETAWTTYQRRICTARYGCVTTWRTLFFDNARSLAAKIGLLKSAHLRGTAIWALGYEAKRPELWALYRRAFPKR